MKRLLTGTIAALALMTAVSGQARPPEGGAFRQVCMNAASETFGAFGDEYQCVVFGGSVRSGISRALQATCEKALRGAFEETAIADVIFIWKCVVESE